MHARTLCATTGLLVWVFAFNNLRCILIDCTQVTLHRNVLHMNITDPARVLIKL